LHNTTGTQNTANGVDALAFNTIGSRNTAAGFIALSHNTNGTNNTATGFQALNLNTAGNNNTAAGVNALANNMIGSFNTANGGQALAFNNGDYNTAVGYQALAGNTDGTLNTAVGVDALESNTHGVGNTAIGINALLSNASGDNNVAVGHNALSGNIGGSGNIAVGLFAGDNLTTGSGNIDIGNEGVAGESGAIRIGVQGIQTGAFIAGIAGTNVSGSTVMVNASGQLGVAASARRFKKEIKPMDKASEAILALKPVTFHYKSDNANRPEFGLVAEEVAEVNRDLVVRDENGEIYTVRYDAVNAMLLNEFLKEHRKNEEQEKTIAELKSGMTALAATVREQASQIQKVNAQLEASIPAPQMVNNDQ